MKCTRIKVLNILYMVFMGLYASCAISLLVQTAMLKNEIPNPVVDDVTKYVFDLMKDDDGNTILDRRGSFGKAIADLYLAVGILTFLALVYGYVCPIINCIKKLPVLYFGFPVILVVEFIMQIVAISYWYPYSDTLQNEFEKNGNFQTSLENDIYENFQADTITDVQYNISIYWNLLFLRQNCCAVNPIEVGSAGIFSTSYWARSGAASSQKIPTSCCLAASESSYTATTTCKDNVDVNLFRDQGCYSVLRELFNFPDRSNMLLGWTVPTLVIEISLGVFAILLGMASINDQPNQCGIQDTEKKTTPSENKTIPQKNKILPANEILNVPPESKKLAPLQNVNKDKIKTEANNTNPETLPKKRNKKKKKRSKKETVE